MEIIFSKLRLNTKISSYLLLNFKLKEELIYKQLEILV